MEINPIDGAEMIRIPAGEFLMGTSEEEVSALLPKYPDWMRKWFKPEQPQRRVDLDGFYLYKTPVTVAQYRRFCLATGRKMPFAPCYGWKDDHPIVCVTSEDAESYSRWAEVRLPTEAEWEKAARGTDGRIWPWGNEWDSSQCHCSNEFYGDARSTAPVERYPQGVSPYGVLDMAGNTWEWCADHYDVNYYRNAPDRNPRGPERGNRRVARGGSWSDTEPFHFRCAYRLKLHPRTQIVIYGLRCARSL